MSNLMLDDADDTTEDFVFSSEIFACIEVWIGVTGGRNASFLKYDDIKEA